MNFLKFDLKKKFQFQFWYNLIFIFQFLTRFFCNKIQITNIRVLLNVRFRKNIGFYPLSDYRYLLLISFLWWIKIKYQSKRLLIIAKNKHKIFKICKYKRNRYVKTKKLLERLFLLYYLRTSIQHLNQIISFLPVNSF